MTANTPALPISSGNLVKTRSHNQLTELGMVIGLPDTIYQMRINQTFTSLDSVASFLFDGGTGVEADIFIGMTLAVGSTLGGHEKGVYRVRNIVFDSAGVGHIDINETSGINFQDNDYLTVLNSMSIWQRDLVTSGNLFYMDYNIPFNSLSLGAIGRIGPPVAIINIDPISLVATFHPVEPDRSACYDGAAIVTHEYFCPGAFSITDDISTIAPVMTFDAAGQYLWWDAITDDLGRTTKTYRWVYVNPTPIQFKILKCTGDINGADWTMKVRTSADMSTIYDRAMVTLYSIYESYNNVEGIIGKLPGYENIKCTGWIDGFSINMNTVEGYVEFDVRGPAFWAGKLRAFPFGVDDTNVDPVDWVHIKELTVDKALAQILFFCSTMPFVMDCFFTDSTTRFKELLSPSTNLWQQITDMTVGTISAYPRVNNLCQLFVEIDPQIISDADRAALPVIQHLEKLDYLDGLNLKAKKRNEVSLLDVSGVSWDGTTTSPYLCKVPGSIGSTYGEPRSAPNYGFDSQADCNRIGGRMYAVINNPYEPIDLELAGQNPFFDIAPRQLATVDVDAEDNPLGVSITGQALIPTSVDLEYNEDTLFLKTTITFELVVTVARDGETYIPPAVVSEVLDSNYIMPKIKIPKMPVTNLGTYFPSYYPPTIPPQVGVGGCDPSLENHYSVPFNPSHVGHAQNDVTDVYIAKLYFPCTIRAAGATHPTSITIDNTAGGNFYGDAVNHYAVYGVKGGARVITGSIVHYGSSEKINFSPVADTPVDYFEVELETGLGSITQYAVGDRVASGHIAANLITPNLLAYTLGVGKVYAVENTGGPWVHYVGDWTETYPQYCAQVGDTYRTTGRIGFNQGYPMTVPGVNYAELETLGMAGELIDAIHARIYFTAVEVNLYYRAWDTYPIYNSGSVGVILRNADVLGRRIFFHNTVVYNACPPAGV